VSSESLDFGAGLLDCLGLLAVALGKVVGEVEARGEDVLFTPSTDPFGAALKSSFAVLAAARAFAGEGGELEVGDGAVGDLGGENVVQPAALAVCAPSQRDKEPSSDAAASSAAWARPTAPSGTGNDVTADGTFTPVSCLQLVSTDCCSAGARAGVFLSRTSKTTKLMAASG
jgi:hypothetical protein